MQSPLKILFVDDHSGLRDGISFLLSKENPNLKFYNASTKEEALEILKNNADIKNAVLDINLNGESSLNCIEEFRKIQRELNIIIYTMYSDMLHIKAALRNNVQGYITKDCDVKEIEKAIEFVSGGSIYYNKTAKEVMQSLLSNKAGCSKRYEDLCDLELFENYKTFTPKEQEVFLLLAQEKNTDEIAMLLGKSEKTVINQKSSIYQKLGIKDRLELLRAARKLGVIL
ncbi:MAG: response regulator transcription factor [Treponema sp.]|nr:response regulator transcription factor [Treponema sp.]